MHASFPAILRSVFTKSWSSMWNVMNSRCVSRLRARESSSFTSLLCHVSLTSGIFGCFLRIFERGVWWYCYRVIKTLDHWLGARSHNTRQLPCDGTSDYSSGLRVASMQSDRATPVWWMLPRNVSINIPTYLHNTLRWLNLYPCLPRTRSH